MIIKLLKYFFLLSFSLSFSLSCSQLDFLSHDKISIWGQQKKNPAELFSIEGKREFYLWGKYPERHVVLVDDLIISSGYNFVSELSIQEYKTWQSFILSVVTLGMYTPTNFVLKGKGVKNE